MKFDFSTPMTVYELLAIILAALALVIPFMKWMYDKYIRKLKINFLASGKLSIFFNKAEPMFLLVEFMRRKTKLLQ